MLARGSFVPRIASNGEQPAMHARMQRLYAAVHHFRKAGQLGNVRTARPAALSAAAVPPVETMSTPRSFSAAAKSTSPVLSETERRARRMC